MLTQRQLTGQDDSHVVTATCCRATVRLQPTVFAAYEAMTAAANEAGLAIDIASGFRDFARQQSIWNRKFSGAAPLYNVQGQLLDTATLTLGEKLEAIMTWSALPGASRHHWGTDLDVFDPRPFATGARQLALVPAEYDEGGPCHSLAVWLSQHAADFGFFFPYRQYRGGVAAEPWHLSYRPLANAAQQQLTLAVLQEVLASSEIAGKDYVIACLPDLKARYIDTICDAADTGDDTWIFG